MVHGYLRVKPFGDSIGAVRAHVLTAIARFNFVYVALFASPGKTPAKLVACSTLRGSERVGHVYAYRVLFFTVCTSSLRFVRLSPAAHKDLRDRNLLICRSLFIALGTGPRKADPNFLRRLGLGKVPGTFYGGRPVFALRRCLLALCSRASISLVEKL